MRLLHLLPSTVLLNLRIASASTNLFEYNQLGQILGTSFGVPGANATFDYVVVGGGTAGLTIATRLAENKSLSVAVIEAGGFYEIDNGNLSVIPGSATYFTGADPSNFQPLVDWGFDTVPQSGANNRTIHYARGKTLGGSSARNYMVYHRPTIDSLQKWADEVGDQSYTFPNLLPYYQKSVQYTAPNPSMYTNSSNTQDPAAFSPSGGPLQVSFSNFVDPFGTWAAKAFTYIGMMQLPGLNSGTLIGSAYGALTINPKNAHRSSSESSFLATSVQNGTSNLVVYKNTMARRIIFSGTTATGVQVTTEGTYGTSSLNYTLSARKEIITSGGVFQSPQLLMVSGIGPLETLQTYSIPIIKDLPGVGQNMWDHAIFGTDHRVNVLTVSNSINSPAAAAAAAQAFLVNASGPLSIFGGGYYGWEKLPDPYRLALSPAVLGNLSSEFTPDWPELEWLPVSAYQGYAGNKQTADPRDGYNYATLNTAIVSPTSRGTVSIQSADMTVPPLIDPAYLTTETDIELAIQAFKRQRQAWAYLDSQGLTIGEEILPGPNVTTDSEILIYIAQSIIELYHAAATNKMGQANDTMAVIDSRCRVFGVQNLRVVDASSFPFLPPGHPQSTIYALAEKIADDILNGG